MIKVGSKVVVLPEASCPIGAQSNGITIIWMPRCDKKTVYTVRSIVTNPFDDKQTVVYLEEGVIGYNNNVRLELGIELENVKEVETGGEDAIADLIKQVTSDPEYIEYEEVEYA